MSFEIKWDVNSRHFGEQPCVLIPSASQSVWDLDSRGAASTVETVLNSCGWLYIASTVSTHLYVGHSIKKTKKKLVCIHVWHSEMRLMSSGSYTVFRLVAPVTSYMLHLFFTWCEWWFRSHRKQGWKQDDRWKMAFFNWDQYQHTVTKVMYVSDEWFSMHEHTQSN